MHITGYEFLDSLLLSLLKITLYKHHITQLMVQIKPQHIKNTIIHITKAPVPLSNLELLNAFLP